jgi:chemotaxis protein CheC
VQKEPAVQPTTDPTNGPEAWLNQGLRLAAEASSDALARWLGVPAVMHVDEIVQCSVEEAIHCLGDDDQAIDVCVMGLDGSLRGLMVLAFDDESGLKLADLLLSRSQGESSTWGEVEISAALESMNILGSAYLNRLAEHLSNRSAESISLLPTPPEFSRDFAGALIESLFMDQIAQGCEAFYVQTRFAVSNQTVHWTFLIIPEESSRQKLLEVIGHTEHGHGSD